MMVCVWNMRKGRLQVSNKLLYVLPSEQVRNFPCSLAFTTPPKDNTSEHTKFNTVIKTHLKSPYLCVSVLKKGGSLTDLETDSSSVSLPHSTLPKHLNLDLRRKPRRVWVGFHAHSLWHLCWDCQQGGQLVPASEDRFFHCVEMTPVHWNWAETHQFPGWQQLHSHCKGYCSWLLPLH